AAPIAIQQR
nr:hypothetical protein [Tanacetum cinerariifolium]